MATIQDRRRDRTGIMFVLTVLTILMVVGVIIFTAISAMASTEAGPAEQGSNSDGKNAEIVVGGAVSEVISKEAGDDSYIIIDGKKVNKEEVEIIDGSKLTKEQLNNFLKALPETGSSDDYSICKTTLYRKKILGIFPRQTTHTIFFQGVDFSKMEVEEFGAGFDKKITGVDCGGCEKEIKEEWGKDILGFKLRCPMKDGEWEVVLRKN